MAVPGAVRGHRGRAPAAAPRATLAVLDAGTGEQRWQRAVHGDDDVSSSATDVLVLVDRAGGRAGRPAPGRRPAAVEPRQPAEPVRRRAAPAVRPVGTEEAPGRAGLRSTAAARPVARATAGGWYRWARTARSGCSTWPAGRCCASRTQRRRPRRPGGRARRPALRRGATRGYRLLAYDLGSLAEPTVLYTAQERRAPARGAGGLRGAPGLPAGGARRRRRRTDGGGGGRGRRRRNAGRRRAPTGWCRSASRCWPGGRSRNRRSPSSRRTGKRGAARPGRGGGPGGRGQPAGLRQGAEQRRGRPQRRRGGRGGRRARSRWASSRRSAASPARGTPR